ncbi:hypothetical protein BSL78_06526 [Apostichopus japonicus]|uniref:Uncharacterized protein n=1 Tax=Stichopus japonicus TaxID=307972 RepID=A0A2G8L8G6_STIJA|nr:hypothetical protein BSL78_06526 [Apostichopus japonicus]
MTSGSGWGSFCDICVGSLYIRRRHTVWANNSKRNDSRIKLQEDTYKKVKSHAETLKGLQFNLITLTKEISRIDGDKNATYDQLKVQRNPPRLPVQLNHSEEFTDSWNQVLQRAGRNLRRIWREELSRQARRQRDRFLEKRSRAETDFKSTLEAPEAQRLLKTILQKSAKRDETRVARRPKARNRKQPYKR